MQLSFGMIFSVILIIVFIAFAFYVIKSFLNVGDEAQISKFTNKFQQDVDKIWKAELASQELEYFLPGKISAVCFVNDEFENLIFESSGYIRGRNIKHIDVEKTLKGEDKFCVYVSDGKIKIILKKDFGENLVTIE